MTCTYIGCRRKAIWAALTNAKPTTCAVHRAWVLGCLSQDRYKDKKSPSAMEYWTTLSKEEQKRWSQT